MPFRPTRGLFARLSAGAFGAVLCAASAQAPIPRPAPKLTIAAGRIDAVFKDFGPRTPGCAVGVYSRGKVLYAKGYGMADLGLHVPIRPTTLFDAGSITKQFTATTVLMLARAGKLRLDDDIRTYVPTLPSYGARITLDDLLHQVSGLRDYVYLLPMAGRNYEDVSDDADALATLAAQKAVNFAPGQHWQYSNTNYFLLSLVVQAVEGRPLAEVAQVRIFAPLGMTHTHLRTDYGAVEPEGARSYQRKGERYAEAFSNWTPTGDGGLQTSVLDFVRWDANFDSMRVGGPDVIAALQQPHASRDGGPTGYGRGLFVGTWHGWRRLSHAGENKGFMAAYMRLPEAGVATSVLCNTAEVDPMVLAENVVATVLPPAREPAPAPATLSPAKASAFPGTYYDEASQSVLVIGATADGLAWMGPDGSPASVLQAADAQRLRTPSGRTTLSLSDDDRELDVLNPSTGGLARYRRVAAAGAHDPVDPALPSLYRSDELGATWKLEMRGDALAVKARGMTSPVLHPFMADGFQADDETRIVFTRDAAGRVDGLDVATQGTSHVHFARVGP